MTKPMLMTILGALMAGILPASGVLLMSGLWFGQLESKVGYNADTVLEVAGDVDKLEDKVHDNGSRTAVIDNKLTNIENRIQEIKAQQMDAAKKQEQNTRDVLDAIKDLEK